MKKKDLKKLVMAGMVAGALAATGVANATEGEVVAAGTHGCGSNCGGKNRPATADNTAPSQQNIQRPMTPEEMKKQQEQKNSQAQPGSCKASGGCNGKSR